MGVILGDVFIEEDGIYGNAYAQFGRDAEAATASTELLQSIPNYRPSAP
jgi:hypothetical protein